MERGRIQGLPIFWGTPYYLRNGQSYGLQIFLATFTGSIGTKAHENVGNSSRGRSQLGSLENFQGIHIWAHCAVIFAIAHSR